MDMLPVIFAAALLASRSPLALGQTCDCPDGYTCVAGIACIINSISGCLDTACPDNSVCLDGSCVPVGAGAGDPVLTGFDGQEFEFLGAPGKCYALYSDADHAVNMCLIFGQMSDHNGTYIGSIGFQYKGQKLTAVLIEDGSIRLSAGGSSLHVHSGSGGGYRKMGAPDDAMAMTWAAHEPEYGRAVTFTTSTLQLKVWAVPPGQLDEGGMPQPSYLNFRAALLGSPAGDQAQGLIGETLMVLQPGAEAFSLPRSRKDRRFVGRGQEADYEVAGLLDAGFRFSVFGKQDDVS